MNTLRNINKSTLLLIAGVALVIIVFVLLIVITFLSQTKTPPSQSATTPTPIPQIFPTASSQKEELERQTEADLNVNTIQNDILKKYPWYNNLPLQGKNYFVYFDVPQTSFIALLYPQSSSTISQDEQVQQLKATVIAQLQQLGVDINTLPIQWQIKPE